eukprot:6978045-Prymnesium_polylepis.1
MGALIGILGPGLSRWGTVPSCVSGSLGSRGSIHQLKLVSAKCRPTEVAAARRIRRFGVGQPHSAK